MGRQATKYKSPFAGLMVLAIFLPLFLQTTALDAQAPKRLMDTYLKYRDRLFSEFVVVSPNVEEFGVNIPATDRIHDTLGKPYYISWGDGNCNFNHYLGFLATEYRLLKNNRQDYRETYSMLIYAMLAIERLDLYSEYVLRKHNKRYRLIGSDTVSDYIVYPGDINGFLIRDDVSLGFWLRYASFFGIKTGKLNKTRDGTGSYLSVFQKGIVAKEEMSQDNIVKMLHALALVKKLVDEEPENLVEIHYINDLIPRYLKEKGIITNGKINISRWVDDLTDRLMKQLQHPFPEQALCFKPGVSMAHPAKNQLFAIISTRWYIMNPVTDELVAEGSGEDMGVWINSFGFAEAGNAITGTDRYHFDGSNTGFNKYLFKSLVFKQFKILPGGALSLPDNIEDYMFRDLAVISDVNWCGNSLQLFYALRDRRERLTYEHQTLILYLLHKDKYSCIYSRGKKMWDDDKNYYADLLAKAPPSGPSSNKKLQDYSDLWNNSSRMVWPGKGPPEPSRIWEFAGLDYLFLHNLYRLVFEPEGYALQQTKTKPLEQKIYAKKDMTKPNYEAEFYYEAPAAVYRKNM